MLVALLLAATQAQAGGLFQVGTGLRPLSLAATNSVFGGGFRAGPTFGAFTPFAGGSLLWASAHSEDVDNRVAGTSWSALAGVRIDLADLDKLAQPFVSAGGLIGLSTIHAEDDAEIDLQAGPGAFAGFGADARLSPAVRLGLEVGVVVTAASGTVFVDDESERASGTASWSYADLHVVFRPGKAK